MEYYILKLYQNEKQKCSEVKLGFDRLEPKVKKIAIGCLIVMLVACAEMIVTILSQKQQWFLIGIIACVIASIVLLYIYNKWQREYMNKYADSHKKKLEILEKILSDEFNISSKEKVEKLINIYQEYVDKKNREEKRNNKLILIIFSALGSVLAISFKYMGLIGIDFDCWISLAIFLTAITTVVSIAVYSNNVLVPLKKSYELMIKDLKELLLIKY